MSCHTQANTHRIKIFRPERRHKLQLISTKTVAKGGEDGRFTARYRTVSMASRWHGMPAPALQTALARTPRGKHHVLHVAPQVQPFPLKFYTITEASRRD